MNLWSTVSALGLIVTAYLLTVLWTWLRRDTAATLLQGVDFNEELQEHTKVFDTKQIIKVAEGIHVAVGYAIANTIFITAPEGLIVVDTTESEQAGAEIIHDYREAVPETRQLEIKAVVYTHNHVDHLLGTKAFLTNQSAHPEVWAHHTLPYYVDRYTKFGQFTYRRAARQFGRLLPEEAFANAGIGPRLRFGGQTSANMVRPTHLLQEDEETVEMAGRSVTLLHTPGETNDQISVWLADQRVFFCADNLYRAFPNLYAIRGTPNRDLMKWVSSLDKIRELRPEYLVPSHTLPLTGEEHVSDIVTVYRDAIQYIHDQTVRYMNRGWNLADIAEHIALPPELETHPYLRPFYGTVPWSVRSVFTGYMGWFGGDPVDLDPLPGREQTQNIIELAGGVKHVTRAAERALQQGKCQWALELSSHLMRHDNRDVTHQRMRTQALKCLAARQISATARNYYLTSALEQSAMVDTVIPRDVRGKSIQHLPLETLFNIMRTRVKAEDSVFNFTDTAEVFALHMRRGLVELTQADPEHYDVRVTVSSVVWRDLLAQARSPAMAYATGEVNIDGGVIAFKRFMDCFDIDHN